MIKFQCSLIKIFRGIKMDSPRLTMIFCADVKFYWKKSHKTSRQEKIFGGRNNSLLNIFLLKIQGSVIRGAEIKDLREQ